MALNIDTNVSNYTISELMAISEVNDINPDEIREKTDKLIQKFHHSNPRLSVFFQAIQSQLLQYSMGLERENDNENNDENPEDVESEFDTEKKIYVEGFDNMEAIYPAGEKQVKNWYENQVLKQSNTNQTDKITERKDKIQVFGNQHAPMNREQLGVNDTYQVPVKQDSLNPNLKNTINRFINLDSQFRQYSNGVESIATDYTLDLSDTLKDVLNISLYSFQIPHNWYAIDTSYGNTCFWIKNGTYNIPVSIEPGNYTSSEFVVALTNALTSSGFVLFPTTPVVYNTNNGKITLNLFGGTYDGSYVDVETGETFPDPFTITQDTLIIFFDFTAKLQCKVNCYNKSNHYFNSTLGWIMGFRVPYTLVNQNGNTSVSILDLIGTKYLILVIDDYNQNHVNNSLVSITELSNTLKMPNYYSPDIPYTCIQQGSNLNQLLIESNAQSQLSNQQNTSNGLLIGGKYENDYTQTQIILPSAPRTLTQSQIYTINEINKNRNNNTNYLAKAPTSTDILAILPIKTGGTRTGDLLVEFGGTIQDNNRTYFGPVNIDRMCVKLLDDKGNVLNLNGTDWCVTLKCECLYQY